MDDARAKPRPARLPAGLIGMLALVLGVEAFVSRHEVDAVPPTEWQYLLAAREAPRRAAECDLLIIGDSQAKMGIIPGVVESRSGLRSYNLAITGASPVASYEVLRRALSGGARPSAVVVDFCPALLAKPPKAHRDALSFLLGPGAALRLGCESRDATFLAELLAREALPSWLCRSVVRSWVVAALEGRASRGRTDLPEALRHWERNDGACLWPSAGGDGVGPESRQRLAYAPRWTPERVNVDYVRRFLALAESNGVAVYWLLPPVRPAVQAASESSGFDARYVAFVEEMRRRFPRVTVLDGRHSGYDPAVFLDPDHLGREGSFALSQDLGDLLRRLRRAPTADRWVSLPPYRPRPTDPDIRAERLTIFFPESERPAAR